MAKKIDLEIRLDIVAQKLQALSQQIPQIHTTALQSANCLSAFGLVAGGIIYQSRLDDLQRVTGLDRDMLNRWCEELASTSPFFTPKTAAEYLYDLWVMSDTALFGQMFQWILSHKGI
jgi:hypothetical protein